MQVRTDPDVKNTNTVRQTLSILINVCRVFHDYVKFYNDVVFSSHDLDRALLIITIMIWSIGVLTIDNL